MKKILSALFVFIFSSHMANFAQKNPILLYNEYKIGRVLLKNNTKTTVPLNYDAANQTIMYLQDDQEMTLMNNHQIDTVFIGNSKFIPIGKSFLEIIQTKNGAVLVKWQLKNQLKGYKGAMGLVTHAKVENVDISPLTTKKNETEQAEVFKTENYNEYWFYSNNKIVKCKNEKDLLKYFPDRKKEINTFIKEHKTNFKQVKDALKLIDYCLEITLNDEKKE